ncbi:SAM-dependent methyltransferase [Streptosporangium becharense]|uniref:SAM-dependent methyltransferase n=1 Tax=Streptosporangium becharense TaxID=1816182 RepID=A0A7W9IH77_9ACTN|nr:class I SAM-dependent methyltransferase [Streptosporangium becharense]MBB2912513.1 SAM-dependent methyltransferase [Streptosporangium becharense]MBB5820657.1 SAM-dependent methyltransferase [Streptosporangium becharense]
MTRQNCADASGYVFDNDGDHSADQHRYLAELLDPLTFGRLAQTGVTAGWSCLEVGAGGGSVALWLAGQVAPAGRVLATDIKPGLIPSRPGLTVARHDVVHDPLPAGEFDLVHARLVLSHLPGRRRVLERLRTALRPGGWLQIDEIDVTRWMAPPGSPSTSVYGVYTAAMARVLGAAGADPTWGGAAAGDIAEAGFTDVDPVCWTETWEHGSAGIGLLVSNSHHLEDRLLEAGMTVGQLHEVREVMTDPGFTAPSFAIHSILARRPAEG